MQQQKDIFNRKHNNHQHSMTLSTPRKDSRAMDIPNNTIQPLAKRQGCLPLRYFTRWFFNLLALVALPIGIMLVMVAAEMEDNLDEDWEQVTATVTRYDEDSVEYEFDNEEGEIGFTLDYFVDSDTPGTLVWTVSVCDLVSRFVIPEERGSEFNMWVDPDDESNQSCAAIDQNSVQVYLILGGILSVLSAIQLLRTIHFAASRPA